jgi:uncharacterized protein (TIGR02466 family)
MISLYEASLDASPNIGTDEQLKRLLDQISQLKNSPSVSNTNDGCWRTEHKYKNIDWLLKEITSKVFCAIDYYGQRDTVFANAIQQIDKKQLQIFYWTNINQPGSRNTIHSHKSAIFSGVYYIQGTDTGALRIINPANMLGECNSLSPFTRDFYYDPKDKDLILWPSWLPHEVELNNSNRERINIAYDVIL